MASNEILIRSMQGAGHSRTSSLRSFKNTKSKTSTTDRGENQSLKNIAKTLRTFRTLDTGALGLFGGTSKGGTMMLIQESGKLVSAGVDIALDINLAKTGESVSIGNIKRTIGYALNPSKFIIEASYGEYLRNLRVDRANVKNEYYRNLTGNIVYGKQYGDKK